MYGEGGGGGSEQLAAAMMKERQAPTPDPFYRNTSSSP